MVSDMSVLTGRPQVQKPDPKTTVHHPSSSFPLRAVTIFRAPRALGYIIRCTVYNGLPNSMNTPYHSPSFERSIATVVASSSEFVLKQIIVRPYVYSGNVTHTWHGCNRFLYTILTVDSCV